MNIFIKTLLLLLFIFCNSSSFAVEVESSGEAIIKNNDIENAKSIALSRAKWAAVESVSHTKIKIDTMLSNSELADEAIKMEVSATIRFYEIINENIKGNKYIVKIKADVVPEMIDSVISNLSRDTSICVVIASKEKDNNISFDNAFTSATISELQEKGFVIDDIDYKNIKNNEFHDAFNNISYNNINKITKNTKCKNILLGEISIFDLGNNVGYGTISFKIVQGELNWKLIEKQNNKTNILSKGSFLNKSQGATISDATRNLYKSMANNTTIKLVSQVAEKILGNNYKSIRIVLNGVNIVFDDLYKLKNDLVHIPFVLEAKINKDNSLTVNYPDKSYYLAVFLERDNKYKVVKLNNNEIIIRK